MAAHHGLGALAAFDFGPHRLSGLALGLTLALGASRTLRSQLFEVTSTDPTTYVAVSLLLVIIAVIACLVPARRATRVSPTVALREE